MHLIKLDLTIALICVLAVTAAGQRAGTLIVTVLDPAGGLVIGAATTLIDPRGSVRKGNSTGDGTVDFTGLEKGQYKIVAIAPGFRGAEISVDLAAGEKKRVNMRLELAEIDARVEVDKADVSDVNSYGTTTDLSEEDIKALPDDPQLLMRVLQQMAGESATGEQVPITVNGIPGAQMPNKQDIKMVRINRNVFSAQYEGVSGAGIEISTGNSEKKSFRLF